jgi:transcriptional regulator with XRE-family HTH domain
MTSAKQARITAGLTLEAAAKRARITPQYLRQIEQANNAPYHTARRLAAIYGAPIQVFLPTAERTETMMKNPVRRCGSSRTGKI